MGGALKHLLIVPSSPPLPAPIVISSFSANNQPDQGPQQAASNLHTEYQKWSIELRLIFIFKKNSLLENKLQTGEIKAN